MDNFAAAFLVAFARHGKTGGVIINEHVLTGPQTRFHVEVLSRRFEFIELGDLPERLASRSRKPFCLLTFDDGKRSNFSETAPVLRRLGVPAVFYVTTKPLTTGTSYWFDRRAQLVTALGGCPPDLELESLKRLPFDQLTARLDQYCAWHGLEHGSETDDVRPMSWQDARSLHRQGFVIGAHGETHAILTNETNERALAEIEDSLATVAREIGVPCKSFAFPNGNFTPELARHALGCGATTVMTTEPIWADRSTALSCLPRVQLFGCFSRARIELKVALAAVKGALANPNGTGRRYPLGRRNATVLCPAWTASGLSY